MIKLFVVGFPREMDEMELAHLFGPHGNIQLLTIARDKMSGKSKGFGFIQMDDAGAQQAITELNGYALGERLLEVRIATDKQRAAFKPVFKQKPISTPLPERKKRPRLSR